MTRTLMFVKAAATIVAEKITIHSGIRLSTATNPEYRRVRDGDGCERGRKAFVTRTAYPQNRGTGGTGTRGAMFWRQDGRPSRRAVARGKRSVSRLL